MKTYSFCGYVAREATLRLAAARFPMARFDKLRFGLAMLPLTEELSAALRGDGPADPFSVEIEHLHRAAEAFGREVSRRGAVVYVEGEVVAGSGWHAGIAWDHTRVTYGPLRLESREPANAALRTLGIACDPAADEITTLKLDAEHDG